LLRPNPMATRRGPIERTTALETAKRHIDKIKKDQNAALDHHVPVRDQYLMAGAKMVLTRPKPGGHSQRCKKTHSSEGSLSLMRPVPGNTVSAKG
jgi:hypothetical protein